VSEVPRQEDEPSEERGIRTDLDTEMGGEPHAADLEPRASGATHDAAHAQDPIVPTPTQFGEGENAILDAPSPDGSGPTRKSADGVASAKTRTSLVSASDAWHRVRQVRPPVLALGYAPSSHRIHDVLAALGARPVTSVSPHDALELAANSKSILIDTTASVSERWEPIHAICRQARREGVPVVFAPTGVDRSPWRLNEARRLVAAMRPAIIRGSIADLTALVNAHVPDYLAWPVPPDASASREVAIATASLAVRVAKSTGSLVVMTGETIAITDGQETWTRNISSGVVRDLIPDLDGVIDAVIGAIASSGVDLASAAVAGVEIFGAAVDAAQSKGPGQFWPTLLDTLAGTNSQTYSAPDEEPAPNVQVLEAVRIVLRADASLVAPDRLPDIVEQALAGGVTMVELRLDGLPVGRSVVVAREVRARCRLAGVPVVIRGRADIVLASACDGIVTSLEVDDLTPDDAARLVGPDRMIGVEVGSVSDAELAKRAGAGYLIVGPMFATGSGGSADGPSGVSLLKRIRTVSPEPLVVGGGMTSARASQFLLAGADGIRVGSAIMHASDPKEATRIFASLWEETHQAP